MRSQRVCLAEPCRVLFIQTFPWTSLGSIFSTVDERNEGYLAPVDSSDQSLSCVRPDDESSGDRNKARPKWKHPCHRFKDAHPASKSKVVFIAILCCEKVTSCVPCETSTTFDSPANLSHELWCPKFSYSIISKKALAIQTETVKSDGFYLILGTRCIDQKHEKIVSKHTQSLFRGKMILDT